MVPLRRYEDNAIFHLALLGYHGGVVIYLYGSASYRRTRKFREVYASYRAKNALSDVIEADLTEDPEAWMRVRDFLNQPSMFASGKLAIVRNPTEVEHREWVAALKACVGLEKTSVLAVDSSAKPPAKFSFLLNPPAVAQEFSAFSGAKLSAFAVSEAKARGVELSRASVSMIIESAHAAFPPLPRQVSKIAALAHGAAVEWVIISLIEQCALLGHTPIPEDIRAIANFAPPLDVYRNIGAISGGVSIASRLAALEKLLLSGEEPAKLFNLAAYGARGSDAITLANLDISVKSGGLEYEEALLRFALSS